jgi:hypothetical protein
VVENGQVDVGGRNEGAREKKSLLKVKEALEGDHLVEEKKTVGFAGHMQIIQPCFLLQVKGRILMLWHIQCMPIRQDLEVLHNGRMLLSLHPWVTECILTINLDTHHRLIQEGLPCLLHTILNILRQQLPPELMLVDILTKCRDRVLEELQGRRLLRSIKKIVALLQHQLLREVVNMLHQLLLTMGSKIM